MKYLFFDIECSNCFNGVGKVCEFGYVITDENFKIISAFDIPMSPGRGRGNRFHLRDRMTEEDIQLAYDEKYYFEQPELPKFYHRIKKLMEDEDTICLAFSMSNDIRYLSDSCKRYGLPLINYTCYDIQQIAAKHLNLSNQPGLKLCMNEIVGPHSTIGLIEHLSRDDAKMEMMIMQAICVLNNIDSASLLEQSEYAKTNSVEFYKEFQDHLSEKLLKRQLKQKQSELVKKDAKFAEKNDYLGKRFGASSSLQNTEESLNEIVTAIHDCGGVFVNKFSEMDYIIAKDKNNAKNIESKIKEYENVKCILLEDFLEMNLKEDN